MIVFTYFRIDRRDVLCFLCGFLAVFCTCRDLDARSRDEFCR